MTTPKLEVEAVYGRVRLTLAKGPDMVDANMSPSYAIEVAMLLIEAAGGEVI